MNKLFAFVTFLFVVVVANSLPSPAISSVDNQECDEKCFDYHRFCAAFHNETFSSELSAQFAAKPAGSKIHGAPIPSCEDEFYRQRCRLSCQQCVPCNVKTWWQNLAAEVESLEAQLTQHLEDEKENDINECELEANLCGTKSVCINTVGSYTCQCEVPCEQEGEETEHGMKNCDWVADFTDSCDEYACTDAKFCVVKKVATDGKCKSVTLSSANNGDRKDMTEKCGVRLTECGKCKITQLVINTPNEKYAAWGPQGEVKFQVKDEFGTTCEVSHSIASDLTGGNRVTLNRNENCPGFSLRKNQKVSELWVTNTSGNAWTFSTVEVTVGGVKSVIDNTSIDKWFGSSKKAGCVFDKKDPCDLEVGGYTYQPNQ